MLKRLRRRLDQIRQQKFKHFDDFQPIIKKIHSDYVFLFPKFSENRDGSRYVYNFGIPGFFPITVEKEHHKDFIPGRYAKRIIEGIEDVLNFVEANVPDESEEKENDNEHAIAESETDARALPAPKLPDRGGEG